MGTLLKFSFFDFGVYVQSWRLRWYDGKSTIKDRNERDRWQLIRNMDANEKNSYAQSEQSRKQWTKNIEDKYRFSFTKVIKFGKDWKLLAYFKSEKELLFFLENNIKSMTSQDWSFRTFKELFRVESSKTKEKGTGPNKIKIDEPRIVIDLESSPESVREYREIEKGISVPSNHQIFWILRQKTS